MSMLGGVVIDHIAEAIEVELEQEAGLTRKMLERVPIDKLGWGPHPKSMTLGRLVSHLVEIPAWSPTILEQDEYVMDPNYVEKDYGTLPDILTAFDAAIATTRETLQGKSDEEMLKLWRFKIGDRVALELPRAAVMRAMVLSHTIHHRGQLSVYLRLNGVPLPQVYGPTADEPDFF